VARRKYATKQTSAKFWSLLAGGVLVIKSEIVLKFIVMFMVRN